MTRKPVCDFDCFNCGYPDCKAFGYEILRHESQTGEKQGYRLLAEKKPKKKIPRPELRKQAAAVRNKRKRYHLSQFQLGKLCGISDTTIWAWENAVNPPKWEILNKAFDKLEKELKGERNE